MDLAEALKPEFKSKRDDSETDTCSSDAEESNNENVNNDSETRFADVNTESVVSKEVDASGKSVISRNLDEFTSSTVIDTRTDSNSEGLSKSNDLNHSNANEQTEATSSTNMRQLKNFVNFYKVMKTFEQKFKSLKKTNKNKLWLSLSALNEVKEVINGSLQVKGSKRTGWRKWKSEWDVNSEDEVAFDVNAIRQSLLQHRTVEPLETVFSPLEVYTKTQYDEANEMDEDPFGKYSEMEKDPLSIDDDDVEMKPVNTDLHGSPRKGLIKLRSISELVDTKTNTTGVKKRLNIPVTVNLRNLRVTGQSKGFQKLDFQQLEQANVASHKEFVPDDGFNPRIESTFSLQKQPSPTCKQILSQDKISSSQGRLNIPSTIFKQGVTPVISPTRTIRIQPRPQYIYDGKTITSSVELNKPETISENRTGVRQIKSGKGPQIPGVKVLPRNSSPEKIKCLKNLNPCDNNVDKSEKKILPQIPKKYIRVTQKGEIGIFISKDSETKTPNSPSADDSIGTPISQTQKTEGIILKKTLLESPPSGKVLLPSTARIVSSEPSPFKKPSSVTQNILQPIDPTSTLVFPKKSENSLYAIPQTNGKMGYILLDTSQAKSIQSQITNTPRGAESVIKLGNVKLTKPIVSPTRNVQCVSSNSSTKLITSAQATSRLHPLIAPIFVPTSSSPQVQSSPAQYQTKLKSPPKQEAQVCSTKAQAQPSSATLQQTYASAAKLKTPPTLTSSKPQPIMSTKPQPTTLAKPQPPPSKSPSLTSVAAKKPAEPMVTNQTAGTPKGTQKVRISRSDTGGLKLISSTNTVPSASTIAKTKLLFRNDLIKKEEFVKALYNDDKVVNRDDPNDPRVSSTHSRRKYVCQWCGTG